MTKKGSGFGYESSTLMGRVSFWDHCVRGSIVIFIEGCSEDIMYLFFSFSLRYIVLVHKVL